MTNLISNKCPRCGEGLNMVETRNALSRHRRGVTICSPCGSEEAMLDMLVGVPIPDSAWKEQPEEDANE